MLRDQSNPAVPDAENPRKDDREGMTFAKIYDDALDNLKLMQAGSLGWALYWAGLSYAHRTKSNGFIPSSKLSGLLSDLTRPSSVAGRLVRCGLWERVGDGYWIHDYLRHNPTREDLEEKSRAARAAARARWEKEKEK